MFNGSKSKSKTISNNFCKCPTLKPKQKTVHTKQDTNVQHDYNSIIGHPTAKCSINTQ